MLRPSGLLLKIKHFAGILSWASWPNICRTWRYEIEADWGLRGRIAIREERMGTKAKKGDKVGRPNLEVSNLGDNGGGPSCKVKKVYDH